MAIDTAPGWTHESNAKLTATPERVFTALTDQASLLHWFAEHVDVDPKFGGKYFFWGKHSYQVPTRRDASQIIIRFEPNRLLAFSWRLDGAESDVTLRIEPIDDRHSRIFITHNFARPQDHELIQDLWRTFTGNLQVYLTRSPGLARPDFTSATQQFSLLVLICAPPERVFRALIEPDEMRKWLGESAPRCDPRVGGEYSYGWTYTVEGREVAGGPTRIKQFRANRLLVVDWPDWRGHPENPATEVSWFLQVGAPGTHLTLIHRGFVRPTDIGDYGAGWWTYVSALRDHVQVRGET